MRVSFQMTLDGLVRALRGRALEVAERVESGEPFETVEPRYRERDAERRAADERGR